MNACKIKKLKMCLSVFFDSMLRRRRAIIMQFIQQQQQNTKLFLKQAHSLQFLQRTMENQLPKQLFLNVQPRFRRLKAKSRKECHWHNLQLEENKDMFFECFRMSHESFQLLCTILNPHLIETTDTLTPSVPKDKQIAICIYKLASCAEYRVVGNVFGVSKSTVAKYFHCVVDAIVKIKADFIRFPNNEEALKIAESFEKISHIPNIFGLIDGTHIPFLPPSEGYRDYINRKGWASMVLQAVVDFNYVFRDASIQFPGSAHDATVFKESGLFKNAASIIPQETRKWPLMLAGDPAYPLLPRLLKPYTGNLTAEEESFNCYLSTARIRVENAYGRLKGRWRCLCKRIDVDPKHVPKVTIACVVLHNFVEQQKESFSEYWIDNDLHQPYSYTSTKTIQTTDIDPKNIRKAIKEYFPASFPIRKSSN